MKAPGEANNLVFVPACKKGKAAKGEAPGGKVE